MVDILIVERSPSKSGYAYLQTLHSMIMIESIG